MSKIHNNSKVQDSNKENINYPNNYSNKKLSHNKKYGKIITNQNPSYNSNTNINLNSNISNQIIANNLFITKEKPSNNINHRINTNYINNKDKNKDQENKYISVNDIIGEKCDINIDILRFFYNNYEQSKTSKKKMGIIKSYGVNTYQGIIRNYNEDRVSIIINMNKPKNYKKSWPKISFFGIYDGHGGEGCSEYLRDNLHKLICINNEFFPDNIPEAIKLGFQKAENDFINNYSLNEKKEIIDRSGSCAVIILIVDKKIYVANVGDSRCLVSMENGKKLLEVTKDHKPNSPNEIKRIKRYGGNIYQSETVINNISNPDLNGKILIGPYRVLPGRLSVSRTIGDVEAKLEKFGGNPNVIISEPEIFYYDLTRNDIDFFILGCDGIYDQITSNEVLECAWMILNEKEHLLLKQCKDIHNQSGLIVDLIIKSALARKSFDNVTCLFVAFKELGMNFIEEDDKKEKNNINSINNNNNYNNNSTKDSKYISSNNSKITPLSVSLSSDLKEKNFEKINMISRKSEASLNNSNNGYINYRNNNNFYLSSNYRSSNQNEKKYPSFYTDYKIRNVKLNNPPTNINQFNNHNNHMNNTIDNLKGTTFKNHRLSNSLLDGNNTTNIMDYSRKNLSLSKINSYTNKNENLNYTNYRQIRNNNTSINNYNNTYSNNNTIKKISEGNIINKRTFGMEKINEENSYINTSSSYIFRPMSKYNYNNENKNIRKNLSTTSNTLASLNSINNTNNNTINSNNNNKDNIHANTTSHRYLINNQGDRINNYTSIRKSYLNLNQKYKFQNRVMNSNSSNINNSINNTYSSISTQNNLKNQKKNLSLNNVENNISYAHNNLLKSTDNKVFSSRIDRIKREGSIQKSINNSNFRLNNKLIDVRNSSSIGKINDNQNKTSYYKEIEKNYQNYNHNTSKNNRFSNYLITETNNKKDNNYYRNNKLGNNNLDNEKNKYNLDQYKRRENNNENNYRNNYRNNRIQKNNNNSNDKEITENRRTKFYRRCDN